MRPNFNTVALYIKWQIADYFDPAFISIFAQTSPLLIEHPLRKAMKHLAMRQVGCDMFLGPGDILPLPFPFPPGLPAVLVFQRLKQGVFFKPQGIGSNEMEKLFTARRVNGTFKIFKSYQQ